MTDRIKDFFNRIKIEFEAEITDIDSDVNKWYELYVILPDGTSRTVIRSDTFSEILGRFEQSIAIEYSVDDIGIDVWGDDGRDGEILLDLIPNKNK